MSCSIRWLPACLLLFSLAHAQGRIDCNALNSHVLGQTVRYCVMLPPGYDAAVKAKPARRYPVLYFLHGLGDNEQSLFKSGGWDLVEDLRQRGEITDFLIVAPEGRGSFYINSADGRVRYSDFFVSEFIPFIEAKYSIRRERWGRAITGVSMGGYGALRFAFAHPELFSSVSAQSAALIADLKELGPSAPRRDSLGRLMGSVFGNPVNLAHWNQNSPFVLARQNRAALAGLAIYFNCGQSDEFGFEKGAQELDGRLRALGVKHEFHLYPGNHSAEYFLGHLGETLKFHSQVFGRHKLPQ
jgi:S-formylglutathione hydrolase FrmB